QAGGGIRDRRQWNRPDGCWSRQEDERGDREDEPAGGDVPAGDESLGERRNEGDRRRDQRANRSAETEDVHGSGSPLQATYPPGVPVAWQTCAFFGRSATRRTAPRAAASK